MDFSNVLNSTSTVVLLVLLLLSFVALLLYYGLFYLRLARYNDRSRPKASAVSERELPSVSVVLSAHNEAAFMKENLVYLLEQNYPDYEVVVVDYMSQDDTPFVLKVCGENYSHLKVVKFREDVNMFRGKKYPLSIGIKSASKKVILLTEPECVPKSFEWIREMMVSMRSDATKMTAGVSIVKQEKGLVNALQQYENLSLTASYMGMALLGNPYTATGRNLALRRDFFFGQGAFVRHYKEPDGADDMFVNENATKRNMAVCMEKDSIMQCDASPNMRSWKLHRKHEYATRKYYGVADKLLMSIYPAGVALFYAALVWLLVQGVFPWEVLVGVAVLKFGWQILTFSLFAKRLEVKTIQFFAPFFEIYFWFANTFLYIASLLKKKNL